MEILSPEQFCWLYAAACIEKQQAMKTLSSEECALAMNYLRDGCAPSNEQVRAWFPGPFLLLEGHSGIHCSLEAMQEYWRYTHREAKEPTPVTVAKVVELQRHGNQHLQIQNLSPGGPLLAHAFNMHRITLDLDNLVMVHCFDIAELAPPEIVSEFLL